MRFAHAYSKEVTELTKYCRTCGTAANNWAHQCKKCMSRDFRYEGALSESRVSYTPAVKKKRNVVLACVVLIVIVVVLASVFAVTRQDATVTAVYTNNSSDQVTFTLYLDGGEAGSVIIQPGDTGEVTGTVSMGFNLRGVTGTLTYSIEPEPTIGPPQSPSAPHFFYVFSGQNRTFDVNAGKWS